METTSVIPTSQKTTVDYSSMVLPVISSITSYLECREKSITERAAIERKTEATLSLLRNRRKVMVSYLNSKFGEREKLYERYFSLIDEAVASKNEELVRTALEGLVTIYSTNPAAGLDCVLEAYDRIISAYK